MTKRKKEKHMKTFMYLLKRLLLLFILFGSVFQSIKSNWRPLYIFDILTIILILAIIINLQKYKDAKYRKVTAKIIKTIKAESNYFAIITIIIIIKTLYITLYL